MRNRMVNQRLLLADLSAHEFKTLVGMMQMSDDYGCVVADPALVRGSVWPRDDFSLEDVSSWIKSLAEKNYLSVGQAEDGQQYALILGWDDKDSLTYQNVNRKSDWRNPRPILDSVRAQGGLIAQRTTYNGNDKRERTKKTKKKNIRISKKRDEDIPSSSIDESRTHRGLTESSLSGFKKKLGVEESGASSRKSKDETVVSLSEYMYRRGN